MVLLKRKELANPNQETNRESIVVDGEKGETDKNLFENDVQSATHDGKDPSVTAATRTGRPKVSYNDASEATKRRMKVEAKTAVAELVHKCDKISKGCSEQLLSAVIEETPLKNIETKNNEAQKLDNMMNDLRKSYDKENQRSSNKIRLLSTIACHFTNKELKKAFPCLDHEITQARRHAKFIGPGVISKPTRITRYRIPVEDIAFVVDFLHHPDNVTRSSHRMASCEGKKSSWLSDLFEQKSQSVMWLRDTKNHLYAKYREDCEANGRRPISETKFRQGLNAGNFKEMVQMVGLCNICDEIGARNWECLDNIIDELKNEISNSLVDVSTLNEDMQEINVRG
ncbi:Hypothetical predicted protein [Paramuricea clavata]|uniref:DNA primase/nucleoside triphosphatase C-terminal domain-containing protein n=1 Tax=Paramuricea clavata TaxID=317549 RepID=A0A6S7J3A1_PARCT|nr:Hypothetical predicted protein [Paramuricea clavata]